MTWTTEKQDTMKGICKMLDGMGCDEIQVTYDGSGDDGSIQDVDFFRNGITFDCTILNEDSVRETIREACYDLLADMVYDWINNEGGYGTITINTKDCTWKNEYEQRIQDTESHYFEGTI